MTIRRHTLVIEGGQLGAVLALTIAANEGLETDPHAFLARRDGTSQVWAFADADDRDARNRWVRKCRALGLSVAKAPWESERPAKPKRPRRDPSALEHVIEAVDKWAGVE